jgi:hypothetical protein
MKTQLKTTELKRYASLFYLFTKSVQRISAILIFFCFVVVGNSCRKDAIRPNVPDQSENDHFQIPNNSILTPADLFIINSFVPRDKEKIAEIVTLIKKLNSEQRKVAIQLIVSKTHSLDFSYSLPKYTVVNSTECDLDWLYDPPYSDDLFWDFMTQITWACTPEDVVNEFQSATVTYDWFTETRTQPLFEGSDDEGRPSKILKWTIAEQAMGLWRIAAEIELTRGQDEYSRKTFHKATHLDSYIEGFTTGLTWTEQYHRTELSNFKSSAYHSIRGMRKFEKWPIVDERQITSQAYFTANVVF